MDLNEIKNRAKDLLADLTEPRPDRDDRSARRDVDDPARDDLARDDPARDDLARENLARENLARDDLARDDLARDDLARDDLARDDLARRDSAWVDPARTGGSSPRGEPAVEHGRLDEPALRDDPGPAGSFADERNAPVPQQRDEPLGEHREDRQAESRDEWADARRDESTATRGDHLVDERRADPLLDPRDTPSDRSARALDEPLPPADQSRQHDEPSALREGRDTGAGDLEPAGAATPSGGSDRLVTAERAESYGTRWGAVKGEFVDEPRQAVAKADALVGELLDELQQLFTAQRRGIERSLDNDDVSTEELRVALRRYRSFFDRLLAV